MSAALHTCEMFECSVCGKEHLCTALTASTPGESTNRCPMCRDGSLELVPTDWRRCTKCTEEFFGKTMREVLARYQPPTPPSGRAEQEAQKVIRDALNGPLNGAVADAKLPDYLKDRLIQRITDALHTATQTGRAQGRAAGLEEAAAFIEQLAYNAKKRNELPDAWMENCAKELRSRPPREAGG